MTILYVVVGYVWHVIQSVIQLLVVLYIFHKLNDRFEIVVVAILGLIYVFMRIIGSGLFIGFVSLDAKLDGEFRRLRRLAGDEGIQEDEEDEALIEKTKLTARLAHKNHISAFFVGVIWVICLYQLLTKL
jgi:hypothetical protein